MLDARGKACPMPVVMAIKELEKINESEVLEVLVDNEAAVGNLTRMAEGKGASASSEKIDADWHVRIIKGGGASAYQTGNRVAEKKPDAEVYTGSTSTVFSEKLVIAIGTDSMGHGDDILGRLLIKSYLFSLTQQEKTPQTIIFFNGGVHLTTESSESLADIRELENRGTTVFSCGTCLDYYGLKEKLAVGSITNMYAIAEEMQTADHLVRI